MTADEIERLALDAWVDPLDAFLPPQGDHEYRGLPGYDDAEPFRLRLMRLPTPAREALAIAVEVASYPPSRGAIFLDAERVLTAWRTEELATMPYREYLRTPEWAERRERAIERAHRRCQLCNAGGALEVHHRTYERVGQEWDDDLIALCPRCHGLFHEWAELAT